MTIKRERTIGRKNLYEFEEVIRDKKTSEEQKILAEMVYTLLNKRLEKNISQDEMVERSGLSKSMISKIENFHANPSALTLIKYANVLGVEPVFVDATTLRAVQKKRGK
jgi:DNA-binding XRE family transcriptional regulator